MAPVGASRAPTGADGAAVVGVERENVQIGGSTQQAASDPRQPTAELCLGPQLARLSRGILLGGFNGTNTLNGHGQIHPQA